MQQGIVFNLQRCSLHDGPGIRTLVFLKGCPLQCLWCCNPESQETGPELASFPSRCIGCGACARACPEQAIVQDGAAFRIDAGRCNRCWKCAGLCYAESKRVIGRPMTIAGLMDVVVRDRAFYQRSGGGVTFSGGEPLMQPDFLLEALKECRRLEVPTAMETSAHGSFAALSEAARCLDTLYIDLKHLDPRRHLELTGVSNALILDNIRKLDRERRPFILRLPIIPGCNDEAGAIESAARFCLELESVAALELLPYHPLGEHKYLNLNKEYRLKGLQTPSGQRMAGLRATVEGILAPRRIPVAVMDA